MSGTHTAILIENVSKLYRIGRLRARYRTLREALMNAASAPLRRLRRRAREGQEDTIWALKDVSLRVSRGEVVGVIGPNGAGKTTLLKVLSRITRPTRGRVEFRGRVGSLLEVGTGFHPELTGRENIALNGAILGMSRREIREKFDEIVSFAEVEQFIDTPIKRYSTGMTTRLAFAVAAHLEPEILAVDEVLSVGDLAFRRKCLGKMQDVSRRGRTILFVSHEMNSVRRLCQKALWLDRGKVRAFGEVGDVVKTYEQSVLGTGTPGTCRVERTEPPPSPKHFSWVALTNEAGKPSRAFAYGDYVRLSVSMAGRTPHRTHFVEWFLTDTTRGHRVAWGGTHAVPEGDVSGDATQVSFLIGPLPLAEGPYAISLTMGVPGVVDLDSWQDAIGFELTGCDPQGTGYSYTTRYAPTYIAYEVEHDHAAAGAGLERRGTARAWLQDD
ncbi:MAG: ABC transporter ATP-binding protein [Planctomycetota bacterium]|jgi:lipopolysaccharide transport system ATP-binding protein